MVKYHVPEDLRRRMQFVITTDVSDAKGPLLILGGEPNLKIATARAQIADRGSVIEKNATPKRSEMTHVDAK